MVYRLSGNPASPFAEKVTRVLTYKQAPFVWSPRAPGDAAAVRVQTSDGGVFARSEEALVHIEAAHPDPALIPPDPAAAAVCLILSAFADQWLSKCRLQQRWGGLPDRQIAAERLQSQLQKTVPPTGRAPSAQALAGRMLTQLETAGLAPESHKTLIASYRRFALRLNLHLQNKLYLFGGQPSLADFALAAQLGQMLDDPTPGDWLRLKAPFVPEWCAMMRAPVQNGGFEPFHTLAPTLLPVFEGEILRTWLPWALANTASAERGRTRFSVTLADGLFEQPAEPGTALAFAALRRSLRQLAPEGGFDPLFAPASLARLTIQTSPAAA